MHLLVMPTKAHFLSWFRPISVAKCSNAAVSALSVLAFAVGAFFSKVVQEAQGQHLL